MRTLAGTVATAVLLLDSETTAPDGDAGPFRVTVPTDVLPTGTEAGFRATEEGVGGFTVSVAE